MADRVTALPSRTKTSNRAVGKSAKKRSRRCTLGDFVTSRRPRSSRRNETRPSPSDAVNLAGRSSKSPHRGSQAARTERANATRWSECSRNRSSYTGATAGAQSDAATRDATGSWCRSWQDAVDEDGVRPLEIDHPALHPSWPTEMVAGRTPSPSRAPMLSAARRRRGFELAQPPRGSDRPAGRTSGIRSLPGDAGDASTDDVGEI